MQSEVGELLLQKGLISEDQLQLALGNMIQTGTSLVQALAQQVDPKRLAQFLAEHFQLPLATWQQLDNLPVFITRLVGADLVLAHRAIPIMLQQGVLYLAMADPTDRVALENISFATGYRTAPVVAAWPLVEQAIARYWGVPPEQLPPAANAIAPKTKERQDVQQHAVEPERAPETVFGTRSAGDGLGELFSAPAPDQSPPVIELTKRKEAKASSSIAEAVLDSLQDEPAEIIVLKNPKSKAAPREREERTPAKDARLQAAEPPARESDVGELSLEQARLALKQAKTRDDVAGILIRFCKGYLPRLVLLMVRRELLAGWAGAGEGITKELVRGLMVPLSSASVFRTVRENATDYFGPLPSTNVNDLFVSALGGIRPARVVLLPVTVQHKPIAVLYGDCADLPAFPKDLSPLHLLMPDVSRTLESIILKKKLGGK